MWCYFKTEIGETSSGDEQWQPVLDVLAFSGTLKHRTALDVEADKQHSRSSLSLPLSLSLAVTCLKFESKEKEKKKGNCGLKKLEKKPEKGRGTQTRREKAAEPRRKWASGGYLRVTGCCYDSSVLWVNCQNIDWSTWQPSPSSPSFRFALLLFFAFSLFHHFPRGKKKKYRLQDRQNRVKSEV